MKHLLNSAAVATIVANVTTPERLRELSRVNLATVAVFALVARGREAELATADELAELRTAHQKWKGFHAQIEGVGHDAAKLEVTAARERYQANPSAAGLATLREAELSKGDLKQHHSKMRDEVKEAMRRHCKATAPLALPVLARALAIVREKETELCRAEEKTAESFGVSYAPSQTARGLDGLGCRIENSIVGVINGFNVRSGPAAILSGIVKL